MNKFNILGIGNKDNSHNLIIQNPKYKKNNNQKLNQLKVLLILYKLKHNKNLNKYKINNCNLKRFKIYNNKFK